MEQSPYVTHSEILLNGHYGSSCRLQEYALSLYAPHRYPFNPEKHLGGFDTHHRTIFDELTSWHLRHSGHEPSAKKVCEAIIAEREAEAISNLQELTRLRAMRPEEYLYPDGEDQMSYYAALEACEFHRTQHIAKGFLSQ